MHDLLRTVLYALFAAASPLALTVTIVVLQSRRARLNGVIYASAFLASVSLLVLLVLVAGSFTVPEAGSGTAATLVELALGLLLLASAERMRRGAATAASSENDVRHHPMADRLSRLTPMTALTAGAMLGVGGPKRLTLTVIAAGSISAADLGYVEKASLAAIYVVLGAVLVWAPVVVYVVAGPRAQDWLERLQTWLTAHQHQLTMWSLAAFGALLTIDALVRLAPR